MIATPTSMEHPHSEHWTMRTGLDAEHRRFAHVARPIVSSLKLHLIALGGAALVEIEAIRPAGELVSWTGRARRRLAASRFSGATSLAVAEMDTGLAEIEEWARSIGGTGGVVTGTTAAGLLDAYQRIRVAASTVWHSEMIPEGRIDGTEAHRG